MPTEKNDRQMQGKARKKRVLVLFAHPSLDRSEVNRPMLDAAEAIEGVTVVDLYAEYPNFQIDTDREQQRLVDHDVIIFQHPLYWYSTPAILKEWQDLVLEHDFAYGSNGTALHGKLFFSAITAGGAESAYREKGFNHFSVRELLRPLEQTASLCGMNYLPPYALFASRKIDNYSRIKSHVNDWTRLLESLRDDRLDITAAKKRDLLNSDLHSLISTTTSSTES